MQQRNASLRGIVRAHMRGRCAEAARGVGRRGDAQERSLEDSERSADALALKLLDEGLSILIDGVVHLDRS